MSYTDLPSMIDSGGGIARFLGLVDTKAGNPMSPEANAAWLMYLHNADPKEWSENAHKAYDRIMSNDQLVPVSNESRYAAKRPTTTQTEPLNFPPDGDYGWDTSTGSFRNGQGLQNGSNADYPGRSSKNDTDRDAPLRYLGEQVDSLFGAGDSEELPSTQGPVHAGGDFVARMNSAPTAQARWDIADQYAAEDPQGAKQALDQNPLLKQRLYNEGSTLGYVDPEQGISPEKAIAIQQSGLLDPMLQKGQQASTTPATGGGGFDPIWATGKQAGAGQGAFDDFAHAMATGIFAAGKAGRNPMAVGVGAAMMAGTRRGYLRRLGMDNLLTGANAAALFRDTANRAGGLLPNNAPPVQGTDGINLPTGRGTGQVPQKQSSRPEFKKPDLTSTQQAMQSLGMDPESARQLMESMGVQGQTVVPTEKAAIQQAMQSMGMDPESESQLMESMGVREPVSSAGGGGLGSLLGGEGAGAAGLAGAGAGGGGILGVLNSATGLGELPAEVIEGITNLPTDALDLLGIPIEVVQAMGGLAGGMVSGGGGILETVLAAPIAIVESIFGGLASTASATASVGLEAIGGAAGAATLGTASSVVGGAVPVIGGIFSGIGTVLQAIASVATMPFGG